MLTNIEMKSKLFKNLSKQKIKTTQISKFRDFEKKKSTVPNKLYSVASFTVSDLKIIG